MRDVASTAGVSLKTVSRVVNREPGVHADTAARVEVAIASLGFARNDVARSLRHGRAEAIGLVIEDVANPFYSAIARTVEDAAHARGHIVITGSCEEDPEREQQLVGRLLRRSVDALLIVPAGADHRYLEPELAAGTPLVFLDRPAVGIEADTVLLDNLGGVVRPGADELGALGHAGVDERAAVAGEALARGVQRGGVADERDPVVAALEQVRDPRAGAAEVVEQDGVGLDADGRAVEEHARGAGGELGLEVAVVGAGRDDQERVDGAAQELSLIHI